jgi:hypothetical protein
MSLFHPETAEDKMAWVPLVGCVIPLVLGVAAIVAVLVWL